MIVGKFQIVKEAEDEFIWIKQSCLSEEDKLNELAALRNYLKETYILSGDYKESDRFIEKITDLVIKIDHCWWNLFTKGA